MASEGLAAPAPPGYRRRLTDALGGRNSRYLARRLRSVAGRYGVTVGRAEERVRRCVKTTAELGLLPTFATPGRVVEGHPAFFRELAEAGAELAVHGYQHVNFQRLSEAEAAAQFERAVRAYEAAGVPCHGFRCPYLSYSGGLRGTLPEGAFAYSSNEAVAWDVVSVDVEDPVFSQLASFYRAKPSSRVISAPELRDGLVEIPASVPDDLQLLDALGLGGDGVEQAWCRMLRAAHTRSELLAPLFHPESFDLLRGPVEGLLAEARRLRPRVWLTQLRELAAWWLERAAVSLRCGPGPRLVVQGSERATVLVRDWPWEAPRRPWDGSWQLLEAREVALDGSVRPLLGARGVGDDTVAFLREQGYLLDTGEHAPDCSVVLDGETVRKLGDRPRLLEHIERSPGPLVKLSRWPDGLKGAICFAGDLDALSLWDYAQRLLPR